MITFVPRISIFAWKERARESQEWIHPSSFAPLSLLNPGQRSPFIQKRQRRTAFFRWTPGKLGRSTKKEDSTGSRFDDRVKGDRGLRGHEMLMRRPLHSNYRCYTVERCRMKTLFFFSFLSLFPFFLTKFHDFYRGRKRKKEKEKKKKKIVGGTIKRNNREEVYRYILIKIKLIAIGKCGWARSFRIWLAIKCSI